MLLELSLSSLALLVSLIFFTWYLIMPSFFSRPIDFTGKHCYVTGGSSGLGLALAEELARRGADITIVARDVKKLEDAVTLIKHAAKSSSSSINQKVIHISSDLSQFETSASAYAESIRLHSGRIPDYVFLCAGASRPGHFVEMSQKELMWNLNMTYLPALHTSSVALRQMVASKVQNGRIVFVSSFLGMAGIVGYNGYCGGKYAIRGLADALRSEVMLYQKALNLKIHLYIPAGIISPGYDEEQKTKPAATRKIEETDVPMKPDECARMLLSGMNKGYYQITNDFITDLVRTQTRGAVPWNNPIYDFILSVLAFIGLPIWRMFADYTVRSHAKQHEAEMRINMEGISDAQTIRAARERD